MILHSKIQHISYILPKSTYTNIDFYNDFPETKENNSFSKIGIKNRHIVEGNVTASDLAVQAAEKLFNEHTISPNQIDFILFCAQEFDYYTPTTACIIQHRLNIPTTAGALDFNLGCTGFLYGLSIAKGLIESQQANNILLLTSSTISKKIHKKDKSSRFIFGDGAAATLISSDQKKSIGDFIFGTDGSLFNKIIIRDGQGRNQIDSTSFNEKQDSFGNIYSDGNVFMDGAAIFSFSLKTVPQLIEDTLLKNKVKKRAIDLFIFHQPNEFLLKTLQKKIDIPNEKFYIFVRDCGNTVSSTIPIALYNAIKEGRAKKGDTILLVAFGVGLSWAGTVIKL